MLSRLQANDQAGYPTPYASILVVDDERISRRVAYRLLTEEGFRVLEADGAEEALEFLRLTHGRVDLVLLDVVMPATNGVELAQLICDHWPALRVLFTSARPAEVLAQHGLRELNVLFLAKPYTRDELLAKIREALERRRHQREPTRHPPAKK